jgi:hypothetical protein
MLHILHSAQCAHMRSKNNKCMVKGPGHEMNIFLKGKIRVVRPPTGLFYRKRPPQLYATHRKSDERRKRHRTRCIRIEAMLT